MDILKIYPNIIKTIEKKKDSKNFLGLRNNGKNDEFDFVADCQPNKYSCQIQINSKGLAH